MIYESRFSLNGFYRVAGIGEIASDIDKNSKWVNAVNERGETPLHIAARHKKFDLFRVMLPYFSRIDARDNLGNTVVHSLLLDASSKHEKRCSELIDTLVRDKGMKVNEKNRSGWMPIHLAAKNCQIQVLMVLEKYSVDFESRAENGETALHLACKHIGNHADSPVEIELIENLIVHGCDVNARNDKGYTALHYAVNCCSVRVVDKLIDSGVDLNCQSVSLQLTGLHLAARNRNLVVIGNLTRSGANIDLTSYAGLTALHLAVVIGSRDVAQCLLDNQADVDASEQWTPLHLSVYLGDRDMFKLLTRQHASVNKSGLDGLSALHLATMLNYHRLVKALIERGAEVNCRDRNGYTPLHSTIKASRCLSRLCSLVRNSVHAYFKDAGFAKHFARFFKITPTMATTSRCNKIIIKLLLAAGADVNALTRHNESVLYFAAEEGDAKLVRILLRLGGKVDVTEKRDGYTPLHAAARWGHVHVVRELLRANASLDVYSNDGKNPLHLATHYNRVDVVRALINAGKVNVDLTCAFDGKSALHLATFHNHVDVIRELLNAKANVNVRANDGKSPLHLALEMSDSKVFKMLFRRGVEANDEDKKLGNTPLHIAARQNNELMIQFLVKFGAKVNATNNEGFTALHLAVSSKSVDAAMTLIGCNADVNFKTTKESSTPLHLALKQRQYSVAEMLIKVDADVHAEDADGVTPLHLAVLYKSMTMVDTLITRGADVDCVDKILGFAPLHVAVNQRDQVIVDLLLRSGADPNLSDKHGLTALHLAAIFGDYCLAELVIHYGADVNCRDANMFTPLHFALGNRRAIKKISDTVYRDDSSNGTLMNKSLAFCNRNDLVELLIDREADLTAVTKCGQRLFHFSVESNAVALAKRLWIEGFAIDLEEIYLGLTALQTAVINDHDGMVEWLVDLGADVNVVTETGKSLLHLAAESGGTRVLELLLEFDDVFFDVNIRDYFGMTPLHSAVLRSNRKDATDILLVHGALMDVQDNNGLSPVHYAMKNNRHQQFESLLAFGLDVNDYKIYSKLDLRKIGYESVVGYRMLQHLMKLKALDYPVANVYEVILTERRYLEDIFYEECSKEIEKLKVHYIDEDTSLYDLLHMKQRDRRKLADDLEPCFVEKEYPIYRNFILDFYRDAVVKESLIKKAESALFRITDVDLPIVCTDKIFYHLGIASLMTLIKAADISDDENDRKNLCVMRVADTERNCLSSCIGMFVYRIVNTCTLAKETIFVFLYALGLIVVPNIVYSMINKWF